MSTTTIRTLYLSIDPLVKKPDFTVAGNISSVALYRGDDSISTRIIVCLPVKLSDIKLRGAINQVVNYEIAGKNGER